MKEFTIGEVAKRTGLAASAIRYYESIGVVPKPMRRNGRRVYNEDWMKWLAIVLLSQEVGFSLKETGQVVKQLSKTRSSPTKLWKKTAEKKLIELDAQNQRILQMRTLLKKILECNCAAMEECGEIALQYISTKVL